MNQITKYYNKDGQERQPDAPDAVRAVRVTTDDSGKVVETAWFGAGDSEEAST